MTPAEAWGIVLVGLILLAGVLAAVCLLWLILVILQGLFQALRGERPNSQTKQIMKGDGS